MIIKDNAPMEKSDEDQTQSNASAAGLAVSLANKFPCSIIVTNLVGTIFEDEEIKGSFEALFLQDDAEATFHYFKSFQRVRVSFSSTDKATQIRDKIHMSEFAGLTLKCYFTHPIIIGTSSHLQPPKREKQFLISPPASPPVGWQPCEEAEPILNFDIISAIAGLAPGESHELHPPTGGQPAIVVHICEEDPSGVAGKAGVRIQQTKCPDRVDK